MDPTTVEIAGGLAAPDLSVWGLFLQADWIVKTVMIILVFASFWTWAVIFDKVRRMRRLWKKADQFEETFWSGGSLDQLYERLDDRPSDPMSAIFVSAMREWKRSLQRVKDAGHSLSGGLNTRIDRVMSITIDREMDRLERNMIFLASIGASAPFIGLFGTVWGIMNAFTSIAQTSSTSLVVVAPGIAEALFATALGLVAAIPATLGFNKLNNDLSRYASRLESFSGEFSAIISRQLEEK